MMDLKLQSFILSDCNMIEEQVVFETTEYLTVNRA
jgi:hypothetical protein